MGPKVPVGFRGLDELAQRLGLSTPAADRDPAQRLFVTGPSGTRYDLIELVVAVLDRLDAASLEPSAQS
jgi:hypothetical protein